MKLTYPFSLDGKVSGIFFPTGKEATCEFASKNCLIHCFAIGHSKDKGGIPVGELKKVYQFFKKNRPIIIAGHILKELNDNNVKVLHWFVSGDCKKDVEAKIIWIIKLLAAEHIVQCGFTRNESFWDRVNDIRQTSMPFPYCGEYKNWITFALTVENKPKAIDISHDGLVSFPNFKDGTFKLYKNKRKLIGCGGYTDPKLEKINISGNCLKCHLAKKGCFTPDGG